MIQGRDLTVWTSHDVNSILTAKGDLWLSDNHLLKYQVLLLEGPVLQLRTCATLNPATFLPDNEEKIEHNCQQVIAQTYATRGDLLDVPLTDPDLNLYTDGSSFVQKGLRKAGYAVVSDNGILESNPFTPGTSAQLAELIALSWALEFGEGKRVNINTEASPLTVLGVSNEERAPKVGYKEKLYSNKASLCSFQRLFRIVLDAIMSKYILSIYEKNKNLLEM
nr:uncharacterized protein LOC129525976 [Gorilla gorilla gorilla]